MRAALMKPFVFINRAYVHHAIDAHRVTGSELWGGQLAGMEKRPFYKPNVRTCKIK